jgi:hypothetical protein
MIAAGHQQTVRVVPNHSRISVPTHRPPVFVKIVPNYPYKAFHLLEKEFIEILHSRHAAPTPRVV